ncbi:MAG: phospho-N-acetylmuramoyl-pentapeptide-transferase [Candidatus Zipacnadales bacterium]
MLDPTWAAAALAAFAGATVSSAALSTYVTRVLQRMNVVQHVRIDGPESHLSKQGTVQMAGLGFVIAIIVLAGIGGLLASVEVRRIVVLMSGFAAIGFVDDYLKFAKRSPYGWNARYRLPLQVIMGSLFVGLTHMRVAGPAGPYDFWSYVFGVFVIVGGTNAANFTDGLDGLAAGLTAIIGAALSVAAGILGKPPELVCLAAIIAGVAAGFLWVNASPAQAFMGDVGSMALGASLSGLAVALGLELIFGILAWSFVLEILSVVGQVVAFQTTGKRILRMAPFHHHLEQCGWPEQHIVIRAWILSAVVSAGVLTFLILRATSAEGTLL